MYGTTPTNETDKAHQTGWAVFDALSGETRLRLTARDGQLCLVDAHNSESVRWSVVAREADGRILDVHAIRGENPTSHDRPSYDAGQPMEASIDTSEGPRRVKLVDMLMAAHRGQEYVQVQG